MNQNQSSVNVDTEKSVIAESEAPTILEDGPNLPDILSEDFVSRFEKGIEVFKRWVSVCYRLTRETHWVNHGTPDKPRYSLQGPGAEALMNPLGVNYDEPTTRLENVTSDDGSTFYRYWVEGYVESKTLGRRGYYVGYCDSRDPFFNARPAWKPETGHGDVRKSATTNWIVNAVTRIAGLRDPDPELLKRAGLDPAKITHIDYRAGKSPEQSNQPISIPQLKRLWVLCKNGGVTAERLKESVVKKYGLKEMPETDEALAAAIKRSDYDALCIWVESGGKPNGNGQPANVQPGLGV